MESKTLIDIIEKFNDKFDILENTKAQSRDLDQLIENICELIPKKKGIVCSPKNTYYDGKAAGYNQAIDEMNERLK